MTLFVDIFEKIIHAFIFGPEINRKFINIFDNGRLPGLNNLRQFLPEFIPFAQAAIMLELRELRC